MNELASFYLWWSDQWKDIPLTILEEAIMIVAARAAWDARATLAEVEEVSA